MAQDTYEFGRALSGYDTTLWAILQVCGSIIYPRLLHINPGSRWRKSEDDVWSCALHGRILSLRQDPTHLHYKAVFPEHSQTPSTPPSSASKSTMVSSLEYDDTEDLVYHYLNLGPHLTAMYEQWSTADANFNKKAPKFTGVRILKQDAWEALIGFICSSNNNIIRISQMVRRADCTHFFILLIQAVTRRWRNCASTMDVKLDIVARKHSMICLCLLHLRVLRLKLISGS